MFSLSNGLHMLLDFAFDINKDVIKVYYHEKIKFLY